MFWVGVAHNENLTICPYCLMKAVLVKGHKISSVEAERGDDYFWLCSPCQAYIDCHKRGDGTAPLGTLANAELRLKRQEAHEAFDPIWKGGKVSRLKMYFYLSKYLGISRRSTHIGLFDGDMCDRVVSFAENFCFDEFGEPKSPKPAKLRVFGDGREDRRTTKRNVCI